MIVANPTPASYQHRAVVSDIVLRLALTNAAARGIERIRPFRSVDNWLLEDDELRDQAIKSLSDLLGEQQRYLVYLRNGGKGRDDDQLIEVRFAADVDHAPNVALVRKLKGKSLIFIGAEKVRGYRDHEFLLISVDAIPDRSATKDAWSEVAQVEFCGVGSSLGKTLGFPLLLLTAISELPEANTQRDIIHKRLSDWQRYLDILERTAREKQFNVAYTTYRRGQSGKYVTFILDDSKEPIPWEKIRPAVDEPIEVSEVPDFLKIERALKVDDSQDVVIDYETNDWLVGTLEKQNPQTKELRILLDEDIAERLERGRLKLPKSAVLRYKAGGDLAQIKRLKFGLESLERGRCENQRLGDFLFDANRARPQDHGKIDKVSRDQLLQPSLNDSQLAAVEGAINAPDLYLIQGPPGTGKTTVIAEICYQNAIRKRRTLIASQANLAVDNAMSRLIHHPAIRALRRGRADRVEEEGKPYLEDQVIATWLSKVAKSCDTDLQLRRERVKVFHSLIENRPKIESFVASARSYRQQLELLYGQIKRSEKEADDINWQLEQTNQAIAARQGVRMFLQNIQRHLQSAPQGAAVDIPEIHLDHDLEAVLKHPSLRQEQASVDVLVNEVGHWSPGLASSGPATENRLLGGMGSLHAIVEYCRAAGAVLESAGIVSRQVEEMRPRLGLLYEKGIAWYKNRNCELALMHDKVDLCRERLSDQSRVNDSQRWIESLRQTANQLDSLQTALTQARPAILRWLQGFTQQSLGTDFVEPPVGLTGPLSQEIWVAALEASRISSLYSITTALQANRLEAETFAKLVKQIEEMMGRLTLETSSDLLARERRTQTSWKASNLSNLVTLDSVGLIRPAPGAEAALRQLNLHLTELLRKPNWSSRLLGAEKRRQSEMVQWMLLFRSASMDFSGRQAALEEQARGLAMRIQIKHTNFADALESAAKQEVVKRQQQIRDEWVAAHARLTEAENTVSAISDRIAALDYQIAELSQSRADLQVQLDEGFRQLYNLTPLAPIQQLGGKLGQPPVEAWSSAWQSALVQFDAAFDRLKGASVRVTPITAIQPIRADVEKDTARLESKVTELGKELQDAEAEIRFTRESLKSHEEQHRPESDWWREAHSAIPERLRPASAGSNIEDPDYLVALLSSSSEWAKTLEQEQAYVKRCEKLVTDWVKRLGTADERDEADLRQIYIDNANVIGITCVQAGARRFSEEYRNFDCVIVDEVSKATPPELLLPMLKGAKIVLIGDSRQLPPMIGPKALIDLAIELNVPEADVEHLKRSMFKELWDRRPEDLSWWLTDQYRMHPQIMDAINQFYANKLVCRIEDPDSKRAHGCDPIFRPDNHIVWIPTPIEAEFAETEVGTSFCNDVELNIIEGLVEQLDAVWQGRPKKDVGVITFYAAQARELKARLKERSPEKEFHNLNIRLGTVDRFQGMERPIVIVSLVRNNPRGDVGFAKEPERVNVAFSRAQELLIIVGSRELFCVRANSRAVSIYQRVADVVKRAKGQYDFSTFRKH